MSFDTPALLGLLALTVISIPVLFIRYRKTRDGIALFAAAAPSPERDTLQRELKLRIIISDGFFLFFTGFLIVAMAGPRWGERIVADYRRGVDVVLAFDLSGSMNVNDCPPLPGGAAAGISRFERGIGIAREFAASMDDVRLGTAIGKGKGVVAVPLTYDSETVHSFLFSLDNQAVTGSGTNLESLINAASSSFQDSIPSRRLVVLFSDGENLSGSYQAAVEKARRAGISVSAVGLGSDEGGQVPAERGPAAPGGILLGTDGTPVISARQEGALKNGAERTGGVYIDGGRNDAARLLVNYVNTISTESRLSGRRRESNPRWQVFVLAAIACLGGARIMGFSRRKPGESRHSKENKPGRGKKIGTLGALLCLLLLGSCAKVQGKLLVMEGNFFSARAFYSDAISSYLKALAYEESAPYAEYGLGAAYFSLEEGTAALERYGTAGKVLSEIKGGGHEELKYRIYYNTGIIYFEKGEFDEAANAFRDALKVDGSRIEAKRNLELSLLTIERTNSPQAASSENKAESIPNAGSGSSSVLFEYLRQKEEEQWTSREWSSESESQGLDY